VKPFKKAENPSKTALLTALFIKMLNVEKYLDMRI